MKVTVIIPTFNEVNSIEKVLKEIPKKSVDEVLVVDGRSTDGTPELVRKLGYKVIFQKGKGYGDAVKTGVNSANGDIIIFMDADGSPNPVDIPRLVKKLKEGYDVVLGSRYLEGAGSEDDTPIRYIGNKFFTFLINLKHGLGITDSLYLFAAFRKKTLNSIKVKAKGFDYCAEVLIKAHRRGFKFGEIPSRERKRIGGKSKVNALYHGLEYLWVILKN